MLLAAGESGGWGGISNGQLAVFIAVGALIYSILRWRKNTIARSRPSESSSSANPLSVREVTAEVQALLAELEETSRRLTAQLDNRYRRIEQLIAEADEKIRRLEALADAAAPAAPSAGSSIRMAANTPGTSASTPGASPSTLGTTAAADNLFSDAQRTLTRLRQERGAPPAALDPAYEPIYSLADSGKTSREIAQELGRQPGEIELILALRQRV
jgi:hypothetical protein